MAELDPMRQRAHDSIIEADIGEDSERVVLVWSPGATGSDRIIFDPDVTLQEALVRLSESGIHDDLAGFFFITDQMHFTHPDLVWPT